MISYNLKNICLFFFLLITGSCKPVKTINIETSLSDNPKIQFAIAEVKMALKNEATSVGVGKAADIVFVVQNNGVLEPEGYQIRKDNNQIVVTGADPAGAMYGGLELAEQINVSGVDRVVETTKNPLMKRRGTKFNIPLDVRTPSYSDPCDAAQNNIPEMWNFEFWKEYIDNLARYRYNFISLWSLHPFPSLVKVPWYEEVALDDVHRSTVEWEEYYSGNGIGFDAPEILANPEIIRQITIDEKIDFWKKVMKYAKGRNIDFYVVTWNIFVNGTEGKYGITDDIDNRTTRDYFRKSVKAMFVSYPDLAGIGLTTGENMKGASTEEKEDWAYATYAQGVLDAAKEMPNRKFTFIHRQHQTGAKEITDKFRTLIDHPNIDFIFSFKYAKAHVYSATTQTYHHDFVEEIGETKTIWTLRNDDIYQYRWGAPDFVREFIQNIPTGVSSGYYYGSDQWIWGREFLSKNAKSPRQLEIVKHWYQWMLWGRLGYDPNLSNERFVGILKYRFPNIDAKLLFEAWQKASMIYPTTTGFHWGPLDFQWYIEACKSRPGYAQNKTGFHDVNRFINLPPHPNSGFQSIPDFVSQSLSGKTSHLKSPLDVAQHLHSLANGAMTILRDLDPGDNRELRATLHDIETIALLGKYYAEKINGSTSLALFRATEDSRNRQNAITHLTKALEYWEAYTLNAQQQNINPLWTNRVGHVNWNDITKWVEHDIELASGSN